MCFNIRTQNEKISKIKLIDLAIGAFIYHEPNVLSVEDQFT